MMLAKKIQYWLLIKSEKYLKTTKLRNKKKQFCSVQDRLRGISDELEVATLKCISLSMRLRETLA